MFGSTSRAAPKRGKFGSVLSVHTRGETMIASGDHSLVSGSGAVGAVYLGRCERVRVVKGLPVVVCKIVCPMQGSYCGLARICRMRCEFLLLNTDIAARCAIIRYAPLHAPRVARMSSGFRAPYGGE